MHAANELGAQAYGALPGRVQHVVGEAEAAREGVADAVGTAWNSAGKHIGDTAKAADGLARRVGTAADGVVDQAIASGTDVVRRHAGDTVADAVKMGADSLHQQAKAGVQFEYGVTSGVLQEGASMVSGVGDLAGGAYRLTVDGKAREQAASSVASNLVRVREDPTGVALGAGKRAYRAGADWVDGAGAAARKGGLPEYLGNATGHVVGLAATVVAPEALLGKAGEAASVLGKTGETLEAGDTVANTSRALDTVADIGAKGTGETAAPHVRPVGEPPPPPPPEVSAPVGGSTPPGAAVGTVVDEAAVAKASEGVLSTASAAEPALTKAIQGTTEQLGGKMVGLENRLKTAESLRRKIAADVQASGATADEVAGGIADAVRYTSTFAPDRLVSGAEAVLKSLEKDGNVIVKLKNTWLNPSSAYKGINVQLRAPNGQLFELQFHTPASFAAKEVETHAIYERMRLLQQGSAEWNRLNDEQMAIARKLEIPKDIERIKPVGP